MEHAAQRGQELKFQFEMTYQLEHWQIVHPKPNEIVSNRNYVAIENVTHY